MGELEKLIEAVEAGVDAPWRLTPFELRDYVETIGFAFGGDLNAAKSLHEALLPGWEWQHGLAVGGRVSYAATVWLAHENDSLWKVNFAVSPNPARAWLLAILKAYRSLQ